MWHNWHKYTDFSYMYVHMCTQVDRREYMYVCIYVRVGLYMCMDVSRP